MASTNFSNAFAGIENSTTSLGASAYGWGSDQFGNIGGIEQSGFNAPARATPQAPCNTPTGNRASTYARTGSQPLGNNCIEMPQDVFAVRGLFGISVAQYMKQSTGQMVSNGIHIIKLSCEDKISQDGRSLEVTLKRPAYPFKISLDEAEELSVKLPYLLRAIRAGSSGAGSNAATMCSMAYNAHQADVQFANRSPISPAGSYGSLGSFSSGPTSPKRVFQPLQ